MGIAILKSGRVIVVLKGAKVAELADHIRNGYPQFVPDLPSLTAVEYQDDALPSVDPPGPPTPEEQAVIEAKEQLDIAMKKVFQVALNHENRIRALEGKAAITAAQFKAALASL
jgi:hypothetical protein